LVLPLGVPNTIPEEPRQPAWLMLTLQRSVSLPHPCSQPRAIPLDGPRTRVPTDVRMTPAKLPDDGYANREAWKGNP
jgi:hypothetical protein